MIIVLNPSDRETSLCANSKQIVSTVVAFYGDEISRQRYRRWDLVVTCTCIYALIVTVTLHSYTAIFFRLNTLYGVLMECYFLECYQVRILIDAVVIA